MSSLARKLCGRKQDKEPHEEVLVPPRSEKEARTLQEARAQVQQQKELFEAIEKCDLRQIKKLKEQFSFKDIKDNHERTPLHVLADLKPEEKKVEDKVLKEIFILLKGTGCDVNSVDEFGNTPVKLAAEKGGIQVLNCLLEEKADITLSDQHKEDTPLHWAAKNGMFKATESLIKHQPDFVNPQNLDKETPLHLAVREKHKKIVLLLLLNLADKNLKDKNNFTPLDIARRADNKEIVDLLEKSSQELLNMVTVKRQPSKDGEGEHVVPDSGVSAMESIPWTTMVRAVPISVHYNVKVEGNAIAAIGPDAKVDLRRQYTVPETAHLDSSSAQAHHLSPSASSPSTSGSPTAYSPTAAPQQLPSPAPSQSTSGSPTAYSPTAALQQLPSPAASPSTSGIVAASPSVVIPTAPLSPLSMDSSSPLPSAPPEEEEDDASSG